MSKKKEIITALTTDSETGAVRIKREKSNSKPNKLAELAIKRAADVGIVLAVGRIVIHADFLNLLAVLVFTFFFAWIYLGFKG